MMELLHPGVSADRVRVVLFDFDGTLSLIRAGWVDVMTSMMVETLLGLRTGEAEGDLRALVEDDVGRLAGKATIHQMTALAEQVRQRGGSPPDPLAYKQIYLARLSGLIRSRVAEITRGRASPDEYLVPGARALLEALRARDLRLYLASGTDEGPVKEEARLLDVARYFEGGVYGARDDPPPFSKTILVRRIVASREARGDELLVFGDGPDEIESVKRVGGVAVGVATDEPGCRRVDPRKRGRLAGAGADVIVPNYLCRGELLATLFRPS